MNLKINILLFCVLLIALLYGDRSFSIGFHANHYVFSLIDIIIVLLTVMTGIYLVFNVTKAVKHMHNQ